MVRPALREVPAALDEVAHHGRRGPGRRGTCRRRRSPARSARRSTMTGHLQLDGLDRRVAHVALADRHRRASSPSSQRPSAPAAALDALHDEARPVAASKPKNTSAPPRAPWCAAGMRSRQRGRQRAQDRVDHGRQRHAPARHRRRVAAPSSCCLPGSSTFSARKRALVDGSSGRGQRLVGDVGAGQRARVDARPARCGEHPVKSMVMSLPATVTLTLMRIGLSRVAAVVVEEALGLVRRRRESSRPRRGTAASVSSKIVLDAALNTSRGRSARSARRGAARRAGRRRSARAGRPCADSGIADVVADDLAAASRSGLPAS